MMVERVKNIKDDEELEMLLGEIPHATSLSHHHHHHHHRHGNASIVPQTMNRMMYGIYDVDDDTSCAYSLNPCISPEIMSPSMFYNDHSSSDTSSSHDPHIILKNPYSEQPKSSFGKQIDENVIDELSRMHINQGRNQGFHWHNQIHSATFGDSDYLAANPHFSRLPMNFKQNCPESNFNSNVFSYCYQSGIPAQFGRNTMEELINPNHDPHRVARGRLGLRPGFKGLATSEDSLIIQGEDVSGIRRKFMTPCENGQIKHGQRYILAMAKDQHGCRLLQKIFNDGNPQHVQIVFNEIIGHAVELMINPFGNYFMQKLLEVCSEEQRMHILIAVTREPRELVQISLNIHGTRVVQKLIETLKTKQQIKLVISAIEPGFLALIKDLNGNHVIQRCLQCLSIEDNKFIFEAATKFCVQIATHQHGCCVLQRCINHSTGEYREKLVSEISKNGIFLAQDAFGNYAVQYILELQIPSAVSKLTSQFKGNYVHLATQKFSSHVVEKCLAVLDGQTRSTIIRELISASQFEQLLQDPHANYVVQTALRVSEGALHNALVNMIESHKAISRNSPYSKRIFSNKLLRR